MNFVFSKLVEEVENIVDEESVITHSALSQKLDEFVDSKDADSFCKKQDLERMSLDTVFSPIIESGGNYDLKLTDAPASNFISENRINSINRLLFFREMPYIRLPLPRDIPGGAIPK